MERLTGFDTAVTKGAILRRFEDILKLLHPITPFVTEEIYQRLPGNDGQAS